MSVVTTGIGVLPGVGTLVETFEQAIEWGPAYNLRWWNGLIDANAIDSGNSPTYKLRPGLVLGQKTATGTWTNYSATATDGSQFARGILAYGLRMQDVLTGTNTQRFYAIIIGGGVKGANLLGLDLNARAQMSQFFVFDDILSGAMPWDWLAFQTKTASYSIVASDNFSNFDNTGATGAVTFTLPAIANGYRFGFHVVADQNLLVTSNEGTNIVAFNNASASTVSFQTAGSRIGGGFVIYSNAAGTKWIVEDISAGANTVTVA